MREIGERYVRLMEGKSALRLDESCKNTWQAVAFAFLRLRYEKKVSQVQLAKKLGTSQTAISRIEKGNYRGVKISTLERMAKALDCRLRITFEPIEKDTRRNYKIPPEKMIIEETDPKDDEPAKYQPKGTAAPNRYGPGSAQGRPGSGGGRAAEPGGGGRRTEQPLLGTAEDPQYRARPDTNALPKRKNKGKRAR